MKPKQSIQLKFVFVGDSNSGKTALFNRMSENKFQPENNFVASDFKFSIFKYSGKSIRIAYWDTISQEKYHPLQPSYYTNANVIFVCYDISSRSSSNNL